MAPNVGAGGMAFTLNVYVDIAAGHGAPEGLLVVTVIITVLPASPAAGVYVNAKGDVLAEVGLTEPKPFSVTLVALPPKVLPFTIKDVVLQVLPLLLPSVIVGGFTHSHDTEKLTPVAVHPEEFLTVIV
jgi:hypothetical protein